MQIVNWIATVCGCSCSSTPDARLQPTPVPTPARQPNNSVSSVALTALASQPPPEQLVIVPQPSALPPTNPIAEGSSYEVAFRMNIKVLHSDLISNPRAHLMKLASLITMEDYDMNVEFLEEEGEDRGGLSRQYFTTLFEALIRDLGGANYNHLHMPRTTTNYVDESGKLPTVLEYDIYYNIGKVLRYCYSHNCCVQTEREHYLIGMRFPLELFTAIFSLPTAEIASGKVSEKTLFAILELLITNNKDPEGKNNALQMVGVLRQTGPITDAQKTLYGYVGPDIKAGLKNQLLKDYGRFIAPMVSIARGMKALTPQMAAPPVAEEFMRIVQGSQDPQLIKEGVQFSNDGDDIVKANIVKTKAGWLKEWIVETTPAERERFLKFVTGASVLPTGGVIRVKAGLNGRLPVSHTCTFVLEVSPTTTNEETKEKFIARLTRAMSEGLAGNFTIR